MNRANVAAMGRLSSRRTGCAGRPVRAAPLLLVLWAGCAESRRFGPSADLSVSRDLSADLHRGDPSAWDAPPGGCTQVANWPALQPFGQYDDSGPVTRSGSVDQSTAPFNQLVVEDWHTNAGETYPKNVTFTGSDAYAACDICVLLAEGAGTSSAPQAVYFAQGGSAMVQKADATPAGGMKATLQGLLLVQYDLSTDKPVIGGKCWQVSAASFDVTWAPTDGGATDLASTDLAVSCAPKINEVQTAGATATDEFVELYNPCPQAVDLAGFRLAYRSATNNSGGSDITLATIGNQSIASMAYFVVGGKGYTQTKDEVMSGGLASTGGAVALYNSSGIRVDSVAYQTLSVANNFTEGSPAPNPPTGQSIARTPNGVDTDNNSVDFKVAATPTPRAAN
jgi:hypothetical protein